MLPIETVAVVGATAEGTACAVLASLAGCVVRVFDASDAALERAFEAVRRRVEIAFASGVITRTERQRILDGLLFTPDLEEALTGADLAVDTAATAAGAAADVAGRLGAALRATAAIAAAGETPAAALAARVPQPGRVLALRLADAQGPVPRVDVLPAPGTSPHVLERARAFAARVNRASRVAVGP
ncbi:MAG TPA: 3-hydroxyacyl-CoA dehydrogenase NAD-binding domain-containing protein [Anaeromyxobacter sp.]|nr:3-hydroxyacyl-CoA dehydrogenase NAD-binding domain-containing protein [Anaeromyxobacter sp.]